MAHVDGRRAADLVRVEPKFEILLLQRELDGLLVIEELERLEGKPAAGRLVAEQRGQRLAQSLGIDQRCSGIGFRIDLVENGAVRCTLRVPEAAAILHPVGLNGPAPDQRGEVHVGVVKRVGSEL